MKRTRNPSIPDQVEEHPAVFDAGCSSFIFQDIIIRTANPQKYKEVVFIQTYFDPAYPLSFQAFSAGHLAALALLAVSAVLLYVSRNIIIRFPWIQESIRWLLAAGLLLPEIALQIWYVWGGIWDPSRSLPLELCSLTMLLSAVMLVTGSQKLYSIVYFAGIGGAMMAMLTPSLDYPFPHFRFIHFFTVHTAIILAPLFMTWVRGYRPTWKSIGWTMIFLNAAALLVALINLAAGSNYMYLLGKPATPSLLDYLGPHPYYIFVEEFVALLLFILMYTLFFALPDRIRHKRAAKQVLRDDSSNL